jgi:hypothetical protein
MPFDIQISLQKLLTGGLPFRKLGHSPNVVTCAIATLIRYQGVLSALY